MGVHLNTRFITLHDVRVLSGLSTASIYRKMAVGAFPRQYHLGRNCVRWLESEVHDWISALITAQRASRGQA